MFEYCELSKILDRTGEQGGLYLGNIMDAKNKQKLEENKIR